MTDPPQSTRRLTDEVTRDDAASVEGDDGGLQRPSALDQDRELSLARVQAGLFSRRPTEVSLARYLLRRRLGAGGLGVVYEAYDPQLDRLVAIKVLAPSRATEDRRARLRREAASMARLVHPNVVAVYDIGQTDDTELVDLQAPPGDRPRGTFIVMELVQGLDMHRWLERPRDPDLVIDVFCAAGRGLAAAHARELIHRDFKPANVMLGKDGSVKVLDFGLARLLRDGDSAASDAKGQPVPDQLGSTLTETGTIMGTPIYMAPEQHDGELDARSDQFAFCASLYEALGGVRPFAADSITGLHVAKLGRELAAPKRPIPRRVLPILRRGLDPDRSRRYPDMEALLRDLERTRRRAPRWAVATGLVVVLGAGTWAAVHGAGGDRCEDEAAGQVATVWTDGRATALREVFATADVATDADKLESAVTRYLADWSRTYAATCDPTAPARERDLARVCLATRREDLATTLDLIVESGPAGLPRAGDLLEAVPRAPTCLENARLSGAESPPRGEVADAVAEARRRLARSAALAAADRSDEAFATARDGLAVALATDYRPVIADAQLRLASASARVEGHDRAIELAKEAFFASRTAHDDAAAADAALLLSWLLYDSDRYDEALTWVRHARAALPPDAPPSERTALAARREASIRLALDDLPEAQRLAEQSLRAFEALDAPHEIEIATTLSVLGMIARQRGDEAATITLLRRALDSAEREYGDQHSLVQHRLTALGLALTDAGDYEAGRAALERSLRLATKLWGADSRYTVAAKRALGHAERHLGHYARARELFSDALRWDEANRPIDDPLRGHSRRGLALVAIDEGKPAEGAALLEQVLQQWRGARVSAAFVAHAEMELAQALRDAGGDRARARAYAQSAATRYEALGPARADDAATARAIVADLDRAPPPTRDAGVQPSP